MREIKFRAWDKNKKKMHNVIQIIWGSELNPYPLSVDFYDSTKPRLFEKVELMQYTELKDKNGKEIYEGDIVNEPCLNPNVDWTYEVYYDENCGWFWLKNNKEVLGEYNCDDDPAYPNWKNLTIIGNIYENPNLLK